MNGHWRSMSYSLAVDIGGTFTDIVLRHSSAVAGRQGADHAPRPAGRIFRRRGTPCCRPPSIAPGRCRWRRGPRHHDRHQRPDRAQGAGRPRCLSPKASATSCTSATSIATKCTIRRSSLPIRWCPRSSHSALRERMRADGTILRAPDASADRGAGRHSCKAKGVVLGRDLLSQQLRQPGQRARGRQATRASCCRMSSSRCRRMSRRKSANIRAHRPPPSTPTPCRSRCPICGGLSERLDARGLSELAADHAVVGRRGRRRDRRPQSRRA